MTLEKLAEMVANGFAEMTKQFNALAGRVDNLERGQARMELNFNRLEQGQARLEHGQEDILLKLDNKPDKIDFPEKFPQYNSKLGR